MLMNSSPTLTYSFKFRIHYFTVVFQPVGRTKRYQYEQKGQNRKRNRANTCFCFYSHFEQKQNNCFSYFDVSRTLLRYYITRARFKILY